MDKTEILAAPALNGRSAIVEAWNDLPEPLRCHPGLKALYRAAMECEDARPPAAPAPAPDIMFKGIDHTLEQIRAEAQLERLMAHIRAAAPQVPVLPEPAAQETVSKKEAIHMINALIAGESLPKDSLVLLDDLCHYASRDQDQHRAQLVAALEEIASMTYDSWTNGARAGEIARAVLKKDKDG